MTAMPWTAWQPLETAAGHSAPAVYQLRIMKTDQTPVPIPRFLGTDEDGLLCIGSTGNMDTRRTQFIRAIQTCSGHSEANLLHLLLRHSQLKERFPTLRLQYRYRAEADKKAAGKSEGGMIKQYVRQFGEPPPLNSAIPDRYGSWAPDPVGE